MTTVTMMRIITGNCGNYRPLPHTIYQSFSFTDSFPSTTDDHMQFFSTNFPPTSVESTP